MKFLIPDTLQTQEIKNKFEPILNNNGLELIQLQYVTSDTVKLCRMFVDTSDPRTSVNLDHLATVNLGLMANFPEYRIELSSPGVDRPLTKPQHFKQAEGKKVKLKVTGAPASKNRTIQGRITQATDNTVTIRSGKREMNSVPYYSIQEANVVYEFPVKGKKS